MPHAHVPLAGLYKALDHTTIHHYTTLQSTNWKSLLPGSSSGGPADRNSSLPSRFCPALSAPQKPPAQMARWLHGILHTPDPGCWLRSACWATATLPLLLRC